MGRSFSQIVAQTTKAVDAQVDGAARSVKVAPSEADVFAAETREFKVRLNAIVGQNFSEARLSAVTERAYAEVFSEQELREAIAFFETPGGQAWVLKQPEIASRAAQGTQRLFQELTPELQSAITGWVAEMKKKHGQQ
jgi:hypothetical protein